MPEETTMNTETTEHTTPQDGGIADGEQKQPGKVEMTQAELDTLIDKAFARGARKGAKEAEKKSDPEPTPEQKTLQEAQERMDRANQKLIDGSVRVFAAELNMTPNGAKAATRLVDFSDCFDKNGDLVDDDVKSELERFLKDYPEFVKAADRPAPYAAGTGSAQVLNADTLNTPKTKSVIDGANPFGVRNIRR